MSKTPILDLEQPIPTVNTHRLLSYFLGLVLGCVLIASENAGLLGERPILRTLLSPSRLLSFLAAFYISILLHELGHVAVAIATGFELRGLAVGIFLLSRKSSRWRFQVVIGRLLAGGLTSVAPRSAENLASRYMRLVLGGPVVSILFVGVSFLLREGFGAGLFLFVNLLVALSSCIPYTARGQPSDAKLLLTLARKGPSADRLVAILYLLALDGQGVQPREWPHEFVERMSASTSDTSYLTLSLAFRHAIASEGSDFEVIANVLESALGLSNKMSPDARRAFFLAASSFQGIFRNNASLAQAWLESARKVKGAVFQRDWDSEALAAISLAKGGSAEAGKFLVRYAALLDRQPATGSITAERARVSALLNKLATATA